MSLMLVARRVYDEMFAPALYELALTRYHWIGKDLARRLTSWDAYHTFAIGEYAGYMPRARSEQLSALERAAEKLLNGLARHPVIYWWPYSELWDEQSAPA